jgi:hypothetical protein
MRTTDKPGYPIDTILADYTVSRMFYKDCLTRFFEHSIADVFFFQEKWWTGWRLYRWAQSAHVHNCSNKGWPTGTVYPKKEEWKWEGEQVDSYDHVGWGGGEVRVSVWVVMRVAVTSTCCSRFFIVLPIFELHNCNANRVAIIHDFRLVFTVASAATRNAHSLHIYCSG